MDAGDSECAALQSVAGPHHGSCPYPGDRYGIVSLPPNLGKAKERSQSNLTTKSRGNDGPWKAWKTKNRFSTLPTALGNRCAIPTFPPLRFLLLYKETKNPGEAEPASPKNQ